MLFVASIVYKLWSKLVPVDMGTGGIIVCLKMKYSAYQMTCCLFLEVLQWK